MVVNAKRWVQRSVGCLFSVFVLLGCGGDGEMEVRDLDLKIGAMKGDQLVKIQGQNFRSDIGYTVHFGDKKAQSVTIVDPKTLVVVTPQQLKAGSVDVTVRADNGTAYRIRNGYKYEDMRGSVMEKLGEGAANPKTKGNLAY